MPASQQMYRNIITVRGIKSFVLRQGRLTDAQAHALEHLWPLYGIDYSESRLHVDTVFHRSGPKILDIGSGMGETLIALAQQHPENDYIAVEVHRPGVGSLIKNAAARGLQNVRVINHDVIDVLRHQLPDRSLDEVYIFFADPWPKKRHHKRRLVNAAFLELLKPKLKTNARIYMATDWAELAEHMLTVCDQDTDLLNVAGSGHYTPRPVWRPVTKFENRGLKLEHGVWDLCYCLR
jgi:tRNA (guanine-N7-)-methyltransferase